MEDIIKTETTKLLDSCGIVEHPVDLNLIMKTNNMVFELRELDDELSGFCVKKGDKALITVNEMHHPNRQRFTTAHEIGHITLHCSGNEGMFIEKQTFNRDKNSSTGEIKEEVEANHFASCLLMPEPFVRKSISDIKGIINETHISTLAQEYEVSSMAMCYRLNKLGLINFFI